ncbi:unnamed protein product [Rotaria sp. Silwood2]|nr:unnamed protein product [Rotaria sp. Silwood2]
MSELTISSTNWLAISLRNDTAIVLNLNDIQQWQYLKPVINDNQSKETNPTTINNKLQQQEKTEVVKYIECARYAYIDKAIKTFVILEFIKRHEATSIFHIE